MARRPRHDTRAVREPVHPFDEQYGTETGGLIAAASLATGHANDRHVTAYYGVAPSILNALIDLWMRTDPPHSITNTTFLDIGAGKGRALLAASLHPFLQVAGIELNPALAAIARRNMAIFAAMASPLAPVSLEQADALTAPLPATPTLAFLFHPFEAPVLRRLLARLRRSYKAHSLDLLYVNAEHAATIDADPAFTCLYADEVPMSAEDHVADLAAIARQAEYGSTGSEHCALYRLTGRESRY